MNELRTLNISSKLPQRETSLDLLRGLAVFLMVLAHSVDFFHTKSSRLLSMGNWLGNTVCFTIFLLVSGAVTYLSFLKNGEEDLLKERQKLVRRALILVVGYYLIALVSSFQDFSLPIPTLLKQIVEILVFVRVPSYTEFLLPFIFFTLLIFIFPRVFKYISESVCVGTAISLGAYVVGYLVYNTQAPNSLIFVKSIVAGESGLYRFPLLQYFPILLLGLWLGRFLFREKDKNRRNEHLMVLSLVSAAVLIFFLLFDDLASFPYEGDFQRWPPSIAFLCVGLTLAFLALGLFQNLPGNAIVIIIQRVLSYLGVRAFGIYFAHLVVLRIYDLLIHQRFESVLIPSMLFVLTFLLSVIAVYSAQVMLTGGKGGDAEPRNRLRI